MWEKVRTGAVLAFAIALTSCSAKPAHEPPRARSAALVESPEERARAATGRIGWPALPPSKAMACTLSSSGELLALLMNEARGGRRLELWSVAGGRKVFEGNLSGAGDIQRISDDGRAITTRDFLIDLDLWERVRRPSARIDPRSTVLAGLSQEERARIQRFVEPLGLVVEDAPAALGIHTPKGVDALVEVSPDRRLVAVMTNSRTHLLRVDLDRSFSAGPALDAASSARPPRVRVVPTFSADSNRVLLESPQAGSVPAKIELYDTTTGAVVTSTTGSRTFATTFSPDGAWFALRGGDTLEIRRSTDGALVYSTNAAGTAQWAGDGSRFAHIAPDGACAVRSTATGEVVLRAPRVRLQTYGLAFAPSGNSLLAIRNDGVVSIDLETSKRTRIARHQSDNFKFAASGRSVVIESGKKSMVIDAETGQRSSGPAITGPAVSLSPDGTRLAVAEPALVVYALDRPQPAPAELTNATGQTVTALAWTSDSKRLAARLNNQAVLLYEGRDLASTRQLAPSSTPDSANAGAIVFRPGDDDLYLRRTIHRGGQIERVSVDGKTTTVVGPVDATAMLGFTQDGQLVLAPAKERDAVGEGPMGMDVRVVESRHFYLATRLRSAEIDALNGSEALAPVIFPQRKPAAPAVVSADRQWFAYADGEVIHLMHLPTGDSVRLVDLVVGKVDGVLVLDALEERFDDAAGAFGVLELRGDPSPNEPGVAARRREGLLRDFRRSHAKAR